MGRQYESETTLQNEMRVASRIASQWNCSPRKLIAPYRIDFALESGGEIKAWLEVKCRNFPSTRYSTLMISVLKWETGILHAQATGLPFIIATEFSDGIKYYRYKEADEVRFTWGGRTRTTRDESDIEPVVHIPLCLFKPLGLSAYSRLYREPKPRLVRAASLKAFLPRAKVGERIVITGVPLNGVVTHFDHYEMLNVTNDMPISVAASQAIADAALPHLPKGERTVVHIEAIIISVQTEGDYSSLAYATRIEHLAPDGPVKWSVDGQLPPKLVFPE